MSHSFLPGCSCPSCQQFNQSISTYSQMAVLQSVMEAAQPQLLPKEIVAAPVEGWRIWAVYPSFPPQLGAVGVGSILWGPVTRARCYSANPSVGSPHSSPDALCGCGLWAFKDDSRVMETLRQYAAHTEAVYGYGRVQLWGKIIECEHGWRGAYARPLQVTLFGADDKTAQAIREFYGCTVGVRDVPEWLRAERAKYWQPHRMSIQPSGSPVVFGASKRRPRRLFFPLFCLAAALVNVAAGLLAALVWHHSTWSWVSNLVVAFFAFIVYLCWDMP